MVDLKQAASQAEQHPVNADENYGKAVPVVRSFLDSEAPLTV